MTTFQLPAIRLSDQDVVIGDPLFVREQSSGEGAPIPEVHWFQQQLDAQAQRIQRLEQRVQQLDARMPAAHFHRWREQILTFWTRVRRLWS